MIIIPSPQDLEKWVGKEIGVSEWLVVTQERIDRFAAATEDFQWIHTEPQKAAKTPLGGTIAHGFLTLSLATFFTNQILTVQNVRSMINYGMNKARFTAYVPVESRLRMRLELLSYSASSKGIRISSKLIFEIEGKNEPVCIAESLSLFQ